MLTRMLRYIRKHKGRVQRRLASRRCFGPVHVHLAPHEVMAVILARDAGYFIRQCVQYHFDLGVRHILVIDNGSCDDTITICREFSNLSVVRNTLPAKHHESALRGEIARRMARGGWLLFVDSDEMLEPPLPLSDLTRLCLSKGYTAVLGQMLDRFSMDQDVTTFCYGEAIAAMDHYSLGQVTSLDYTEQERIDFAWFLKDNICDQPRGRLKTGGVRLAVFGENPMLTKHCLVQNHPNLGPMGHPHAASNVVVADVSVLLHHYKFAGGWQARDRDSVAQNHWMHGQDVMRLKAQKSHNLGPIWSVPDARKWDGIAHLQRSGFLDWPVA